jgi:hypothetical protein
MRIASVIGAMKTFPSPIFPVFAALMMALDSGSCDIITNHDLDFDLRQKINRVLTPSVDLRVALSGGRIPCTSLTVMPSMLSSAQGFLHILEFERLDDRFDFSSCKITSLQFRAGPPHKPDGGTGALPCVIKLRIARWLEVRIGFVAMLADIEALELPPPRSPGFRRAP